MADPESNPYEQQQEEEEDEELDETVLLCTPHTEANES